MREIINVVEGSSKYIRSATLKDGTTITLDLARWQPDLDRLPDEGHTPVFLARALLDGKMIGFAEFYAYDRKSGSVEQVEVNQEFRRKGVATALYDYLEGLGLTVEPTSSRMEPDGRAFWSKRNRRALDEAFPAGLTNGGATNVQTLHNLDPEHAEADERLRLHHGPQGEPDDAYDALHRYTELSGRFTRGLIAGGLKKGPTTGFTADDVRNLKSVDGYVSRARPLDHELVVYSALGFLPEGDTFVSPAFLSTSIDPARAAAHANDRRRHRKADVDVIGRFHLPAGYTGGRYLGRFSKYRGEAEFLLARGQTFRITGRHTVEVADGDTTFTRHIIDLAPSGA